MIRFIRKLVLGLVIAAAPTQARSLDFPEPLQDMGRIPHSQVQTHRFAFANTSERAVRILRVQATCGCTVGTLDKKVYKAGERGELVVTLDPEKFSGRIRKTVSIQTDDPDQSRYYVTLTAFVERDGGRAPRFSKSAAITRPHVDGEVLVRFRPSRRTMHANVTGREVAALATEKGAAGGRLVVADLDLVTLELADGETVAGAIARLNADPDVLYAQPNYLMEPRTALPNDEHFDQQWYLRNTGSNPGHTGGTPVADVDAPEAWEIFRGNSSGTGNGAIVAVLDNGFEYTHPDLGGVRASATIDPPGSNNQFKITSLACGQGWNGIMINFSEASFGTVNASYDSATRALSVELAVGGVSANDIIDEINQASLYFSAELADGESGSGTVSADQVSAVTAGASDCNLWDGKDCVDHLGNPLGDCIHGYDYTNAPAFQLVGGDRDPHYAKGPLPRKGGDHGTHVAGLVGAISDNDIGVSGIAPDVDVMLIRSANYVVEELVKGIYFAMRNGATVINASWGYSYSECEDYDLVLYDAAAAFPGIFVMAAGVSQVNHNLTTLFDSADFGHDACWAALDNYISVTNSDRNDAIALDYGIAVDMAAPGQSIYNLTTSGGYLDKSGTSMAAPLVAGAAALVWGFRPELTAEQVREVLRNSGDCIEAVNGSGQSRPLFTTEHGYCDPEYAKRLNVYNALASLANPAVSQLQAFTDSSETSLISQGAIVSDRQPYWTWLAPQGQGIMDKYLIHLADSEQTEVYSGATTDPFFDAESAALSLVDGEYTLTVTGRNNREKEGDPVQHVFTVATTLLAAGWNSVSISVDADDLSIDAALGHLQGVQVWRWDAEKQRYVIPGALEAGGAYFVFAPVGGGIALNGDTPWATSELELHPGWNFIGVPHVVSVRRFRQVARGRIWCQTGTSYEAVAELQPGNGYWLFSAGGGIVDIGD
jgi:subtilisin family serine protease